jgi:hypothetical protein
MKGFALGLSLSLAFVLGCVAAPVLVPRLDAQPATGAPRWEMQCIEYRRLGAVNELTRIGDQAGANGWEPAWVMENLAIACFKRPRG